MADQNIPSVNENALGVSNPEVKVSGGTISIGRTAIKDEKQAWQLYVGLKDKQNTRNTINAEIAQRYTGKQPRDPFQLKQEGRSWQSNFPTGMLAGIIDRIVPNFLNAVEQQQYLTQATLPEKIDNLDVPDRDKKIETFREEFTKRIKSWREWRGFNAALVTELVLIGYDFALHTDEDTPWPMFFRQDKCWIYEGSPQFSEYLQVLACEQPVLIHQLIDKIKNRKSGDGSGWNLENCAEALNKAMPFDRTADKEASPRDYADIIREASTAESFQSGAKGITLAHLFVIEPDKEEGKGRITHWILDVATQKPLFTRIRRFDDMSDVVTLFTLEPGNNKFYGSRGVGRMLANLSIGVDELVNDAVSQMKMAGMMIIKTDTKTGINAQIKVRAPFAVVNTDGELQKEQFPTDIQGFVSLYEQLTKIAEVAVGAYIPNVLATDASAGRRTAREASIDYSRELQSASAYIARFVSQYQGEMLYKIQKRFCKKGTSDQDAKDFQQCLKDRGLSEKEIELLGNSPTVLSIEDLSGKAKQEKDMLATELAGNPMVDQKKLLEMKIISKSNPDLAKELMLPDAHDQIVEAEAIRMQAIETKAMEGGEPIPPSPRDPHDLHLKYLIPQQQKACQGLLQAVATDPGQIDPKDLDGLHLTMMHGEAHLNYMIQAKMPKEQLEVPQKFYKWMDKVLIQAAKAHQDSAERAKAALAQQKAIMMREHLGMPAPGADPNAGLPEGVTPEVMQGMPQGTQPHMAKIALSISYKDAPEHIKRQIEKAAGFDTAGLPDGKSEPPLVTNPPAQPLAAETTGEQETPAEDAPEPAGV